MTYDWDGAIAAPPGTPEFFEQSDRRAIEAHRPFGHPDFPSEAPYSRLINWEEVCGQRILEIGCGLGLHATLFASAGARVVTMDLTETAVKLTRARCSPKGIAAGIVRADGERLPYPAACFDQVWSWGVIHHSANTPAIVAEIRRVLKPGGLFRAMVYHRRSVRYWIVGGLQHGLVRLPGEIGQVVARAAPQQDVLEEEQPGRVAAGEPHPAGGDHRQAQQHGERRQREPREPQARAAGRGPGGQEDGVHQQQGVGLAVHEGDHGLVVGQRGQGQLQPAAGRGPRLDERAHHGA